MQDWNDIKRWRRAQREQLLEARLAAGRAQREQWNARILPRLRELLPAPAGRVFGVCWPFKGEFDARALVSELLEQGAQAALPAVVQPRSPLEFRFWRPGDPTERGVYQIPVPKKREVVEPDVLLVPLVGFDDRAYRLGYGGGYFDRTIAAMRQRPLAIGIGYELARLTTVYPQPHDIPMDAIVTEQELFRRPG